MAVLSELAQNEAHHGSGQVWVAQGATLEMLLRLL